MSSPTLTVALVGYGAMGAIHAQNLKHNPRTHLKYVVGNKQNNQKGEAFAAKYGAKYISDLKVALDDKEVQAVVITAPTAHHYDAVFAAVQAKKAVLCEKPLATSSQSIKQCFDEAAKNQVVLFCGFHRRFDPNFQRLKAQLPKLGAVELIRITSRDPGAKPEGHDHKVTKDKTHHTLYDSLIHDFDMARWLVGEAPATVTAVQQRDDAVSVLLQHKNGVMVVIDWAKGIQYGYDQRVEVFGENGLLQADNKHESTVGFFGAQKAGLSHSDKPHEFFPFRYPEAYAAELEHFIDAILDKKTLEVTAQQCLETAHVADLAAISIAREDKSKLLVEKLDKAHTENGTAPATKKSDKKTLNIALIGAGRMGSIRAERIAKVPRAKLVYVVDVDKAAAERLAAQYGAKSTTNIDEALADPSVEAVWISVSTPFHPECIKKAAAAKKPIYCEKPISLSVAEIDEAFAEANKAGVPLLCGWNRRFDPAFSKLHGLVKAEGKPVTVLVNNGDHPLPPVAILKTLGSLYHDFMVHDLDCAVWMMGEFPTSLYATGHSFIPGLGEAGVLDAGAVVLTFPSGATAVLTGRRRSTHGYDQRIEVLTSNGKVIKADNILQSPVSVSGSNGIDRDTINNTFADRYAEAYQQEVYHFVDVVLDGVTPKSNHKECRQVAILTDAALKSQQNGKTIIFE